MKINKIKFLNCPEGVETGPKTISTKFSNGIIFLIKKIINSLMNKY